MLNQDNYETVEHDYLYAARKVSDCCNATETALLDEDMGRCPECKERCTFIDVGSQPDRR